jgi:hypothetical protein
VGKYGLDSSGSEQGLVTASCEHGNEPLGSIRGGEFTDQLRDYQFLDCGPWSKVYLVARCMVHVVIPCKKFQKDNRALDYELQDAICTYISTYIHTYIPTERAG